jgi:aspartate racemase
MITETEPVIETAEEIFVMPMSFGQQRLWLLDQLEPNNSTYNITMAYRFTGRLHVSALEQSLNEIVQRHESLRTTFAIVDGQPAQLIAPALTLSLPLTDLTHLSDSEQEYVALNLMTEASRRPFDLEQGPLLRANLVRLNEQVHLFLLTMHHITSDGWSMSVFEQELVSLYTAFITRQPSPLPELPIQYADFAIWQREWLQGPVLEEQLTYWRQQLDGSSPVLELPTDHPRPPIQTFEGARQTLILPPPLVEALKSFSREEGVTLFMTLLAGFQTLLYRYTGQEDISIGSPIANRNRTEIEGLIGLFINTLVLRTGLSGNPTFRELLKRVREVALGAYAHQDLPFEQLIEALQPERNQAYTPLFQILFVLQNTPKSTFELPGLTLHPVEIDNKTAKFDLSLYIWEDEAGLTGYFEYNTDLFDATTITRMAGHFQTLLAGLVTNPDQPVATSPLLTEAERQQIVLEWNKTKVDYPHTESLVQLLETQVERSPEATAFIYAGQTLSYRELNARANQMAHYLQKLGVGPEVLVGICAERSLDMVIGLLGILKAGGAYVPLDPAYPKDRLAFMLNDAQVAVLLTQQPLLNLLPPLQTQLVCLDRDWPLIAQQPQTNPTNQASADNLAYVIYTSGSTGQPKGVQIPHAALLNFLASMHHQPGLNSHDTLLAVTTLSFDIAGLELFLPLSVGARVVLVSHDVAADGTQLASQLAHSGATVMQATPATWRLLLETGWSGQKQLKILCGGEALPRDLADQLLQRVASVWNMYGPTETTIWSAAYPLEPQDDFVPIGGPIANTQLYLLDPHLQLVPVGIPGELYIGGAGLARGYLNRPDLTAEKFIPDPFSPQQPNARLYRTGDLARYLPDGRLEFLGRLDHQVKIRGFRIELGEIETILNQHPTVQTAVVVAQAAEQRLVAYLLTQSGQTPSIRELRSYLAERLPDYMLPSVFVPLETLPLTPNGKVDRRALPVPDTTPSAARESYTPPRNPTEAAIAAIWTEILGLQQVSIHDDFFELGGHSLIAVRLFAKIKKTFAVDLSLATLFQVPTIAQFAELLQDELGQTISQTQPKPKKSRKDWSPLVAIQPKGSKPPFFCVHGIHGNVLAFSYLARYLGAEQPFYGLQAQGADGKRPGHRRLEDMAALYLEEICSIQPEGPYHLGGFSMGGEIAFEMAQQLSARGQEVALLALLDTVDPGHARLRGRQLVHDSGTHDEVNGNGHLPGAKNNNRIRKFLSRSPREKVHSLIRWTDGRAKFIRYKIAQLYLRTGRTLSQSLTEHYMAGIHSEALLAYTPQPYPGRITLFRALTTLPDEAADPAMRWSALAQGGLEVHLLDSPHEIIDEPYVQILAEKLRSSLA